MDNGTDGPGPRRHSVRLLSRDFHKGSPSADGLLSSSIVKLQATIKTFSASSCLFKIAHIVVNLDQNPKPPLVAADTSDTDASSAPYPMDLLSTQTSVMDEVQ
jgi:hypothetical protein